MNEVIVFQMGKVGSRSVQLSLRDVGVDAQHKHKYTFIKNPHPTNKIITLTRDPVARNFSAFFAHLKRFIPNIDDVYSTLSVQEYVTIFVDNYNSEGYLTWFENNIERYMGIDVYEQNFDPDKGYLIIEPNLLILRVEDLDTKGVKGIKEFVGVDIGKPRRSNRREDWKIIGPYYAKAKRECVMPQEFLDKMYSSRYATYFYTAEEIEGFRKKWGE